MINMVVMAHSKPCFVISADGFGAPACSKTPPESTHAALGFHAIGA
jgi:hypothetical protein